jgi:hypothetical protein
MSYVLSAVDTSGIQSYIFGSNRLRENVGASEHVLRATTDWIWQSLEAQNLQINRQPGSNKRDDTKNIDDDNLDAEVIYAAGGNALILFKNANLAIDWARQLSKKALMEAPGLTLLIAHSEPFDWKPEYSCLAERVKTLFSHHLAQLKRTRIASTPLLGLGVTATCQSTGLVATEVDSMDKIRVSREVAAKAGALTQANERFFRLLQAYQALNLEPPKQLDDLNPNKGERSYIAVVHADGNGIGRRFQTIWDGKTNLEGIRAVRELSDKLSNLASEAFQSALAGLITANGNLINPYTHTLPVRPLIYGGDDLTFVCDGRVGVGLAARYLHEFEQGSMRIFGEQLTVAAGVAIVKTHYPFARAYELSEALCKSAKRLSRDVSTLDWHVAMSGTLADIDEIRKREYQTNDRSLEMRPMYLQRVPTDKATEHWRTWQHVEEVIRIFQTDDTWAGKRNKIKQLREVLRNGEEAVKQFQVVYQTGKLPGYSDTSTLKTHGWIDNRCGYFDPIELLDLYVPPSPDNSTKEARWLPTS